MNRTPEVTTPEMIERRAGYQSLEPVKRPAWWGVDLDHARRPGVPSHRTPPQPMANASFPIEPQQGEPASPLHGRTNKQMPPVFGTSTPLRGLSGVIRRLAYSYPDHYPRHWVLKLLGDRVDSWEYHAKKYLPVALPLVGLALFASSRGKRRGMPTSWREVETRWGQARRNWDPRAWADAL
ncbi:hypothetical protein JY651_04860 [Pyxidicoccus parkwayensis]|uniref:Uncharacterized protein n=1 Tax=Pyxidicoccus parkwayensis TaxID=2813578 RepID=A0ABX7NZE0_9BACT|nr:hypothetical protein [Pyxidicoccus parkwaysis]QSQ24302.1 hypothetical protein JY651_04860 [Pyxidicoccus parkwaysis]